MDATVGHPVLSQQQAALTRRVGSGVLILLPLCDDPVLLDGGATAIWDALQRPKTRQTLITELSTRYGTPADELALAAEPVISDLCERGLLREQS